jgi:hypothetical protein
MPLTNKMNLPAPIYNALNSDYQPKLHQYSVTTILNPIRQVILKRRYNDKIEQDCSELIWALFGTSFHAILEKAKEEDTQFKEEYLKQDLNVICDELKGYILSGKADLIDVATKTIIDYKTTSTFKVLKKDFEDYRLQLLIYAWLFKQLGFEINKGEIVALLRDWQKSKAKFDKDYPQFQVQKIQFKFTEKDFEFIEDFIKERFIELKKYENIVDEELPICTDEERWREPTKYAVKKKANVKASKLHDTLEEAQKHLENLENKEECKGQYEIEVREGTDKRCLEYCSCCEFCPYYIKNYMEMENKKCITK